MEPQALWIIALSIATSVAGVVGFAIQLREVKTGHLENEKLQLEIEALKVKAAAADKCIVQVTTAEVQRFATKDNILFSKAPRRSEKAEPPTPAPKKMFKEFAIVGAIILGLLLLAGYFLYDIYRLAVWLGTKL